MIMYFQGKKTEQNKIEDTLEKAGGEETMSDKLKVNMNEYLPLRDVVRKLTTVIYAVLRDSKPYEPKKFC